MGSSFDQVLPVLGATPVIGLQDGSATVGCLVNRKPIFG
jgi:hypothetical protein